MLRQRSDLERISTLPSLSRSCRYPRGYLFQMHVSHHTISRHSCDSHYEHLRRFTARVRACVRVYTRLEKQQFAGAISRYSRYSIGYSVDAAAIAAAALAILIVSPNAFSNLVSLYLSVVYCICSPRCVHRASLILCRAVLRHNRTF